MAVHLPRLELPSSPAISKGCTVSNSVVGESVYIGRGSVVEDSLLLRNSYWASDKLRGEAQRRGERVYGVGENCHLRKVVVDENTTIGNNVKILNKDNVQECDRADSGAEVFFLFGGGGGGVALAWGPTVKDFG